MKRYKVITRYAGKDRAVVTPVPSRESAVCHYHITVAYQDGVESCAIWVEHPTYGWHRMGGYVYVA
jgi:hypothetical protein